VRGSVFGAALVLAVVLGTAIGSAGDEWGCTRDRIGHSLYTNDRGGGDASPDDAAVRIASELAREGPLEQAAYEAAMTSREGPTRYEPDTGKVFVDGNVYADVAFTQLADGTWAIDNMTSCMRPPSRQAASPFPTPGV
jgi:hypothetical protein